jgi:hypothetical protein
VWVALSVAALALGPLASPAMVLCRGENGHVDVEVAFGGCCQDGTRTAAEPAARAATLTPEHPCGECTDVSVGQGAAPVPRCHLSPPPMAAGPLGQPPPSSPRSGRGALQETDAPSRDLDLAVVRATVLLR